MSTTKHKHNKRRKLLKWDVKEQSEKEKERWQLVFGVEGTKSLGQKNELNQSMLFEGVAIVFLLINTLCWLAMSVFTVFSFPFSFHASSSLLNACKSLFIILFICSNTSEVNIKHNCSSYPHPLHSPIPLGLGQQIGRAHV